MRVALLALIASLLFSQTPGAAQPNLLVVFELTNRQSGLGSRGLKKLSASLSAGLLECGHQVVAPARIKARLRKITRRVPRKRMAQARLLKARRTLVGSVRKRHSYCRIDAFLMNAQTGERLKNFSVEADCKLEGLLEALPLMTTAICEQLQAQDPVPAVKPQDVGGTINDAISTMEEIAGLKATPGPTLPRGKKAKVSIVSDPPGAEVRWDRKPIGQTPLQIENVEPRHYRLTLTRGGFAVWQETVRVTSSVQLTISLFLDHRQVRINTRPPGARVYVNGDRRGQAPVRVNLPAGKRHEIRARLENHEETFMEFKAQPATAKAPPQQVTVELTPKPVYLMVDVSPEQARVVIGKEQLTGSGTVGVIPGKRTISATAEGYQPKSIEVDIPVGKPHQLQLRLKRLPAWFEYRDKLSSKRAQAWTTLSLSILAFSASVPMIKWSFDSDRAADEWNLTARLSDDPADVLAAEAKSLEAEDQALWTGIVGYGSVAVGVLALGWSLYSFLTYPDEPAYPKVGASAGRLLLHWDF